ncbi:MAG: DUF1566 domain-containing protein [Proteobacteria bacterium]|nr:DUF1566 domain-containing protein [Pseudomonadota bacterium]MBU1060051.1 DUF1566 domain-containing protein [Pseudomonadota bacterium]
MGRNLLLLFLLLLSSCAQLGGESERFLVNSDGTVLDTESGLMWAAADNGQGLTWAEAQEYCNSYRGGGYHDWRLPKKIELDALFKAGIRTDKGSITIRENWVWAAETDDSKGAYCSFKMGGCDWVEQVVSFALRALPVRDTRLPASASPPSSVQGQSPQQRLQVLDLLHKQQLITQEEYERKKTVILDAL